MSRLKISGPPQSLTSHLAAAFRAWWGQDRVRVSPREGRLLRLRPPCIVTVDDEIVELTHRGVGRSRGDLYVTYTGVDVDGQTCELVVVPSQPNVTWRVGEQLRVVSEDDVQVFQRTVVV